MPFTPLPSLLGGLMLSLSTSSLLAGHGRVLGISGIAHSVVASTTTTTTGEKGIGWKEATFAGLLVGGSVLGLGAVEGRLTRLVGSEVFDDTVTVGLGMGRVLLAGGLVGLGTKLGSGCTSGHMLCGLARFSKRSFVGTCTFFAVALLTAQLFPATLPLSNAAASSPVLSLSTIALLQLPFLGYTLAPRLLPSTKSAELLSSFLLGMHFAFGLALAGMTAPSKVLSFFYLPLSFLPQAQAGRAWDPSLVMVALGGLLPNMMAWRKVKSWKEPLHKKEWELPTRRDVDWKLVGGSAMFGVGWGLLGICPGPMLTVLGAGKSLEIVAPFFASFAVGGLVGGLVQ